MYFVFRSENFGCLLTIFVVVVVCILWMSVVFRAFSCAFHHNRYSWEYTHHRCVYRSASRSYTRMCSTWTLAAAGKRVGRPWMMLGRSTLMSWCHPAWRAQPPPCGTPSKTCTWSSSWCTTVSHSNWPTLPLLVGVRELSATALAPRLVRPDMKWASSQLWGSCQGDCRLLDIS